MDVLYRACELDSYPHRPAWFDKKKCFKSLIDSLDSHPDHTVYCVFDGEEKELADYIKSFPQVGYEKIKNYGNLGSLRYCLDFTQELNGNSVYLLEDDYLHLPEAIRYLDDGIKKFRLVTGYDHPDRYHPAEGTEQDITAGREMIKLGQFCHWRTAESTTGTFAAARDCLSEIFDYARHHLSTGQDRAFFRDVYTDLGIRLFTPIPGVSAHCCVDYLSPHVKWEEVNASVSL
tara:strand:- start:132 stop:827 length:696 start_codon:yes stop_codon:yes gene_type:complete